MTDKKIIVVKTTDDLAMEGLIKFIFGFFVIAMLFALFFKFLYWLKEHPFIALAIAIVIAIAICYGVFIIFKKIYSVIRRFF